MHEYGSPEYNRVIPAAIRKPGSRAAIVIDVYRVGSVRSPLLCIRGGHSPGLPAFMHSRVDMQSRSMTSSYNVLSPSGSPTRPKTWTGRLLLLATNKRMTLQAMAVMRRHHLKCLSVPIGFSRTRTLVDGLPGLLTAPGAVLSMTPQSNFDKNSPRPMLRRGTEAANTTQVRKWFLSGFMLGAVTMFVIIRLAGSSRGRTQTHLSFT